MKAEDRFGRPIYPRVYNKMLASGEMLVRYGYRESTMKPNLFFRQTENATFFADMRGTEEVPIWKDASPLFYAAFKGETPPWKERRELNEELARLEKAGCECRQSFYQTCDNEKEFDELNDMDPAGQALYDFYMELPDGYCKVCGKDMQANAYHCSDACREVAKQDQEFLSLYHEPPVRKCRVCGKVTSIDTYHCSYECQKKARRQLIESELGVADKCGECGKRIVSSQLYSGIVNEAPDLAEKLTTSPPEKHHVSYVRDEKVKLCAKCHSKIHHASEHPLKPRDRPEDKPKKEGKRRQWKYTCWVCGAGTDNKPTSHVLGRSVSICRNCRKKERGEAML